MNRHKGCFYGLAIGDALGSPLEFKKYNSERQIITNMEPTVHFSLPPGSWTDDTSMMLCLAESLIESGLGPQNRIDQLDKYTLWWREGHNSVNGKCFDIGGTVKTALRRFKFYREEVALTDDEMFQGNGSLMRLAPIPMLFWRDSERAGIESSLSSETTHANIVCKDVCKLFGKMVACALQGASKEQILSIDRERYTIYDSAIHHILNQSYITKTKDMLHSDSWIVHTIETVLWTFANFNTFEDGLISIINMCGDADTNGAIYGMLAGAYYGYDAIPLRWLEGLQRRDVLDNIFTKFIPLID